MSNNLSWKDIGLKVDDIEIFLEDLENPQPQPKKPAIDRLMDLKNKQVHDELYQRPYSHMSQETIPLKDTSEEEEEGETVTTQEVLQTFIAKWRETFRIERAHKRNENAKVISEIISDLISTLRTNGIQIT